MVGSLVEKMYLIANLRAKTMKKIKREIETTERKEEDAVEAREP